SIAGRTMQLARLLEAASRFDPPAHRIQGDAEAGEHDCRIGAVRQVPEYLEAFLVMLTGLVVTAAFPFDDAHRVVELPHLGVFFQPLRQRKGLGVIAKSKGSFREKTARYAGQTLQRLELTFSVGSLIVQGARLSPSGERILKVSAAFLHSAYRRPD